MAISLTVHSSPGVERADCSLVHTKSVCYSVDRSLHIANLLLRSWFSRDGRELVSPLSNDLINEGNDVIDGPGLSEEVVLLLRLLRVEVRWVMPFEDVLHPATLQDQRGVAISECLRLPILEHCETARVQY